VGSRPPGRAHHRPVSIITDEAEQERTRWDPKDGELCLSRLKPEETLVEDRSDSDVTSLSLLGVGLFENAAQSGW